MHPAVVDHRHARWQAVHSHRGDLIAQGISRGLSRQDAEDVASESILRAAVKDDLDVDRAGGWLRTVAHHLAVDLHRSRPSDRVRQRLQHASVEFVEPQVAVDDRLEAEWVASVVDALPDRQRRALHYRAAGFTVEEIADRMDANYKTVESLISRARSAVRKSIGATLGLLGLVLSGRRRGLVTPSVALAVPCAALAVWCTAGSGPVSPDASFGAEQFRAAVLKSATRPVAVARPTSRRVSIAASRAMPATVPTVTTHLLPPGQAGPVKHGDVSVTRSEPDEGFVASVERCIAKPVALDPDHLGCQ